MGARAGSQPRAQLASLTRAAGRACQPAPSPATVGRTPSHRIATALGSRGEARIPMRGRAAWVTGGLLLLALVVAVGHLGEGERFAALVRASRPEWLALAALLQAATYVCAGAVWQRALRTSGGAPRLRSLAPLGLAKLFADQALPSAGMSGTLLVVRALVRRGVARGPAVGAMLAGLLSFYAAYVVAVAIALAIFWRLGELHRAAIGLGLVFGAVAALVPLAIVWLRGRPRRLPGPLARLPLVREALAAIAEAPRGPLLGPRLAAETIALQLAVFALDAATLAVMLRAIATPVAFELVFASFVLASMVATLAWVPGGLGTFEGTCVALLHLHGVPLEAALAGTLLLRGFTFWLPMAPGLWIARRELAGAPPGVEDGSCDSAPAR